MNLNFPQSKFDQLLAELDKTIQQTPPPHYAAFDADGTLWATDLGEALFRYEIKHQLVPLPPDPWGYYEELKEKVSHEVAYLWLAQINKGLPLSMIRAWAEKSVEDIAPVPVFPSQQKLVRFLLDRGVIIFIVTASIKWAVEPGAKFFGLNFDNVIGIKTAIDSEGLITDQQDGPITWRRGKVEGLMLATNGKAPIFSAGNTEGDLALLECASHVRLVMAASPITNDNYATERKLLQIATQRGWFYHDFVGG